MREPLHHEMVAQEQQEVAVRDGSADAALVRLPVADGLHVVRLYEERAFAMLPIDHPLAEREGVTSDELADDAVIARGTMTWSELAEVIASGVGIATMPQSLARLHRRRDVAAVPVDDLPPTTIALAWRPERDGADVQALVGIVRGRSARSSR
jgi:DNA-binding transcriptional LysR family regulator